MTRSRDPIRDRPVPVVGLADRARLTTSALPRSDDLTLLAGFVATVARHLDSPTVTVAWGGSGAWQPITVTVDLDAAFASLVDTVSQSLTAPDLGSLPSFGVTPSTVVPGGPAPALLVLDGAGQVDYAARAYEPDEVRRFVDHLATLTAAVAGGPGDAPVGRLPLVGDAERDLLAPDRPPVVDDRTVVDLIAEQVRLHPDTVAVRADGEELTYRELWSASGRLAADLPHGARVGLWAERNVPLMIGLVATLRAGSAYVALEPGYPAARLRTVVELAGLPVVLAGDTAERAALDALGVPVHPISDVTAHAGAGVGQVTAPRPDDLAYVMFTSGSTGVPKGVMIEHRNVVNTLLHMAADPGLSAGEVMLGVTTPAFDLSVPDLLLPLVTGATLVLAEAGAARDARRLAALIDEHRPDLMQATPSSWRLLCDAGWPGAPRLRVVCGGEAYDSALVRALTQRVAGVWNFYGPTETTVWSVSTRLSGLETDPLPLGASMRGVACYLLDSRGEPAPRGVRAEVAIAGAGVARGYLGRSDLTSASFVPCPFPGSPSSRMYLTGDLARVAPDGSVRFAGRRDQQVKVNGFRIELGEIEAVLQGLSGVAHAVATVRDDDGRKRIVGYVVAEPGGTRPDGVELRGQAASLLPPQSVPAVVVLLDRLPLTANGKVDRAALPAPAADVGRPLNGELENLVAEAVGQVLGVVVRHADDSLFALGADSLLVGRIAIRLTSDLGVDVSPGLLFRHPVVEDLARALLGLLLVEDTDVLDDLEAVTADGASP